jgi:hypothetical protein
MVKNMIGGRPGRLPWIKAAGPDPLQEIIDAAIIRRSEA